MAEVAIGSEVAQHIPELLSAISGVVTAIQTARRKPFTDKSALEKTETDLADSKKKLEAIQDGIRKTGLEVQNYSEVYRAFAECSSSSYDTASCCRRITGDTKCDHSELLHEFFLRIDERARDLENILETKETALRNGDYGFLLRRVVGTADAAAGADEALKRGDHETMVQRSQDAERSVTEALNKIDATLDEIAKNLILAKPV